MAKRKRVILLLVCVLALGAIFLVGQPREELQFLDSYRVSERMLYQDYNGYTAYETRFVTVKIDRGGLRKLLMDHYSVGTGWNVKLIKSHFDPDGYQFRATKKRGSLGDESITCLMTDFKNYKNEYIVFHSKPMSRFEVLRLRIEHIGHDPFRTD